MTRDFVRGCVQDKQGTKVHSQYYIIITFSIQEGFLKKSQPLPVMTSPQAICGYPEDGSGEPSYNSSRGEVVIFGVVCQITKRPLLPVGVVVG